MIWSMTTGLRRAAVSAGREARMSIRSRRRIRVVRVPGMRAFRFRIQLRGYVPSFLCA